MMYNWVQRILTGISMIGIFLLLYYFTSTGVFSMSLAAVLLYGLLVEYRAFLTSVRHARWALCGCIFLYCVPSILLVYWAKVKSPLLPLVFVSAVVIDSCSYIVGKLFGRTNLAPSISPGKTWEGFVGGCVGMIFVLYTISNLFVPGFDPFSPAYFSIQALARAGMIGIFLTTSGLLGDLYISYLKRKARVKDSGSILPGHGGLLDRLDSITTLTIAWYLIDYLHLM